MQIFNETLNAIYKPFIKTQVPKEKNLLNFSSFKGRYICLKTAIFQPGFLVRDVVLSIVVTITGLAYAILDLCRGNFQDSKEATFAFLDSAGVIAVTPLARTAKFTRLFLGALIHPNLALKNY